MKAKHNRIHEMRYSFFYSNPLHKIKFIKFRFHSCRDAAIIIETHKHTRVRARDEEKKSHEAASINGVFNSILFQEILRCYLLFSSFSLSLAACSLALFLLCVQHETSFPFIFSPSAFGALFSYMRENKNKNKFWWGRFNDQQRWFFKNVSCIL